MQKRHFNLDGETWAIELDGASYSVTADGKTKKKLFATPEMARESFDRLIAEQLEEGWEEDQSVPESTSQAQPDIPAPTSKMTSTSVDLEEQKKNWLQNLASNQALTFNLLNQALRNGVDIQTQASKHFDEHVAPELLAAAPAPEPVAESSRLLVSLGHRTWPLFGSTDDIFITSNEKLGVVSRLLDSVTFSVLDPVSGACETQLTVETPPTTSEICFTTTAASPDGKYLAVIADSATSVSLWDVTKRSKLAELPVHGTDDHSDSFGDGYQPNKSGGVQLCFSGDSQKLAVSNWSRIQVFEVPSGKETASFPSETHDLRHLRFSPDGKQISWILGKSLHIQDLDGFPRVINGDWKHVHDICWSPTGDYIGIGSWNLHLVDLKTDTTTAFEIPDRNINCRSWALSFTTDGGKLYGAGDQQPLVSLDLASQKLSAWGQAGTEPTTLAVHPDGDRVFIGYSTELTGWKSPTSSLHRVHLSASNWEIIGEFGCKILTATSSGYLHEDRAKTEFGNTSYRFGHWSIESTKGRRPATRSRESITAISPRGDWLAYISSETAIISSLTHDLGPFKLEARNLVSQSFSEDARRVLLNNYDEVVAYQLDEFVDPKKLWTQGYKITPGSSVHGTGALSPDGEIALVSCPGCLQAYSISEKQILWEAEWSIKNQVTESSMRYSAETFVSILGDGRYAVLCHNEDDKRDMVTCYDLKSGEKLASKDVVKARQLFRNLSRRWSRRATKIALPDAQGVAVWNLANGEVTHFGEASSSADWERFGHPLLSPDESLLAIPRPNQVSVYSTSTGELVEEIQTETATAPISLAWLPKKGHLVTSGSGHSYQVWDMEREATKESQEVEPALGERDEPVILEQEVTPELLESAKELEEALEWFDNAFSEEITEDTDYGEAMVYLLNNSERREIRAAVLAALPLVFRGSGQRGSEPIVTPVCVEAICKMLDSEDPLLFERALNASELCLTNKPPHRPTTVKLANLAISYPDAGIRCKALYKLRQSLDYGHPEVLAAVAGALKDEHPRVQIEAMRVRKKPLNEEQRIWFMDQMREFIDHADSLLKFHSLAAALGASSAPKKETWLLERAFKALEEPDLGLRYDAASLIKDYFYRPAIPVIVEALPASIKVDRRELEGIHEGGWSSIGRPTKTLGDVYLETLQYISKGIEGADPFRKRTPRAGEEARAWFKQNEAAINKAIAAVEPKEAAEPTWSPETIACQEMALRELTPELEELESKTLVALAEKLEEDLGESDSLDDTWNKACYIPVLLHLATHSENLPLKAAALQHLEDLHSSYDQKIYPDKRYFQAVSEALDSTDENVLRRAIDAAAQATDHQPILEKLIALIHSDERAWVRSLGLDALSEKFDFDVWPTQHRTLEDENDQVVGTALNWLSRHDVGSIPEEQFGQVLEKLQNLFEHPNGAVKARALQGALRLTGGKDPNILGALERALKDPDSHVRLSAGYYCMTYEHLPAIPILATHGEDYESGGWKLRVTGPGGASWGRSTWGGSTKVHKRYPEAVAKLSLLLEDVEPFEPVRGNGQFHEQALAWYTENKEKIDGQIHSAAPAVLTE